MNAIETVDYFNNKAAKILKSHKAQSNEMLLVCLQAKAFELGIEKPFEWASEMVELIESKRFE